MVRWRVRTCDFCKEESYKAGDLIVKKKWRTCQGDSGWSRLDICTKCADKLVAYIREKAGIRGTE